jgi:hypothetical protein
MSCRRRGGEEGEKLPERRRRICYGSHHLPERREPFRGQI